jgi:hypothetical protein
LKRREEISVFGVKLQTNILSSNKENRLTGYKVGDEVYLVIYSSTRCETWKLDKRGKEE